MAATSPVQICSNALLMLGDSTIASLEENSARATLCANLWDTVRDAVLRSHPWNCAMKRVALAPDAVAPAFDWAYSFTLPADVLRVWTVGQDDETPPDWHIENGKLMLDDAIAYVRYIQQLTDASRYDSMLRRALTSGMAAALAYPVTKSQSQQEAMVKLHEMHLRQARTVDGQEGTGERTLDSPLIAVRR